MIARSLGQLFIAIADGNTEIEEDTDKRIIKIEGQLNCTIDHSQQERYHVRDSTRKARRRSKKRRRKSVKSLDMIQSSLNY